MLRLRRAITARRAPPFSLLQSSGCGQKILLRDLRVSLPRVGLPRGFLMFHQHLVPWIVAGLRKKSFAHSHDRPAARPLLLDSTRYGLRHGPVSMYFTIYSSTGLPLCRASHERTIRPPAENALHVYVDPGRGPPAWSGFPVVYKTASRMVGPPGMLMSVFYRASCSVGLPMYEREGLRQRTASMST